MFQIDNDTSSLNLPAPTAANRPGYFVDGDPAKGLAATILPAEFMNMLMMEFINLVKASGLTPNKADYTQLSQAIPALIAKLATVDWSKVTNIPADLVHANTVPTFSGVGLFSSTPYVDFHYGSDASQFNVRVINNADGTLSVINKSGTILTLGPGLISSNLPHYITKGAVLYSQGPNGSFVFYNATGTKLDYCFQHDDNSLNIYTYPDAASGFPALSMIRNTGQFGFNSRPLFGNATPWDSANFNPATKANAATTLAGYGITDALAKGAYGVGGTASQVEADTFSLPGGFYSTATEASNPMQYSSLINMPYADANYTGQIGMRQGVPVPQVFVRSTVGPNQWTPTVEMMHTQSPTFVTLSNLANSCAATLNQMSSVVEFFACATPPPGYLKANGALVSRTAYATLFAAIGTRFGAGDGSTTFALPDLRGEFIRGFDDARGVDVNRVLGSFQAQDIQPHTHTVYSSGNNTSYGYQGTGSGPGVYVATSSAGVTETRPRNVALLACIKY